MVKRNADIVRQRTYTFEVSIGWNPVTGHYLVELTGRRRIWSSIRSVANLAAKLGLFTVGEFRVYHKCGDAIWISKKGLMENYPWVPRTPGMFYSIPFELPASGSTESEG